jgi:hypothetical protein
VIEYVAPASPVTVNLAAVMVPPVINVTPPVGVRVGAAAAESATVPGVALTVRRPKSISTFFVIAIGVRIVAVAVAVAVAPTWANVTAENAKNTIAVAKNFVICFIFSFFWLANIKLKFLN